jgi:hypothetical protein
MAVGAEESQVCGLIVMPIPVSVVHLQNQGLALPLRTLAALCALMQNPRCQQSPAKLMRLATIRPSGLKNLSGSLLLPRGLSRCPPLPLRDVGPIDAGGEDSSFEVLVLTPGERRDSELPQHCADRGT